MLEKLMRNPYAWLVLALCSIFSLVFAIYTWIIGRKRKEISIDYSSNAIIKQGKTPIEKLNIEFDGKQIQDLVATTYCIWNSGNEVISKEDVVGKHLKIECESEVLLDTQVIIQSDESNNFVVTNMASNSIELGFEYMDSGEGVRLQILHTNLTDDLLLCCKLKGGNPIRNCNKIKKDKSIRGFIRSCIDEFVPMILFLTVTFSTLMVSKLLGFHYEEHGEVVLIVSVVATVLIYYVYMKMKKRIRNVLHRTIPNTLKE